MVSKLQAGSTGRALAIPEVLARILSHTILKPNNLKEYTEGQDLIMTRADPPWPFLLVSKHWHQVVTSTPALWSTILLALNFCQSFNVDFPPILSVINAHLERSKNAPLTVLIFLHDDFAGAGRDADDGGPVCNVMERLMALQHRWQDVTLHVHIEWFPHDPIGCPPIPDTFAIRLRDMKALVKLDVNLDIEFSKEEDQADMRLVDVDLGPCPRLEHLRLGSGTAARETDGAAAEICLPNLRCVSIRVEHDQRKADNGWRTLLKHSSSVERLEVNCCGDVHGQTGTPVELPNLRSMEIKGTHVAHALQWFTIPPLAKLSVTSEEVKLCDEYIISLMAALSNLALQELSLVLDFDHVPAYREEVLQEFIRSCGGLRTLSLNFAIGKNVDALCASLISAISPAIASGPDSLPDQGTLLPQLNVLQINLCRVEATRRIDVSSVRRLIFACRKRYDNFRVDLSFSQTTRVYRVKMFAKMADKFRLNDEIRACVTDSFSIYVSDVKLENVLS